MLCAFSFLNFFLRFERTVLHTCLLVLFGELRRELAYPRIKVTCLLL